MSLFRPERARVELLQDSVELWTFNHKAAAWRLEAARAGGVDSAALRVNVIDLSREHVPAGADLSAIVGDGCARHFVVDPPANARRPVDLRLAARMRFADLYGDAPAGWAIAADWRATRPFLACAIPSAAIVAMAAAAQACKLRQPAIESEFTSSWNAQRGRMRDRQGWVVHLGRHAVTVAACVSGAIEAASMMAVHGTPSLDELAAEILRFGLRSNRPAPRTAYLLGPGAAPLQDATFGTTSLIVLRSGAEADPVRQAA